MIYNHLEDRLLSLILLNPLPSTPNPSMIPGTFRVLKVNALKEEKQKKD